MAGRPVLRASSIATLLVVTTACSPAAGPPAPTSAPTLSSTAAPSAGSELAAAIDLELNVEGGPDFPIAAFGSLWVLRPDQAAPSITRLDLESGALVADIPVGTRLCQATGASPDAIWACGRTGLVRIDPATNTVTGEVAAAIGQYYGHLPFGAGSIWTLGGKVTLTDTLLRVDPERMAVTASVPLGANGGGLAFGFDAAWITVPSTGTLLRFDPATGTASERTTGLAAPGWVATGFGSVWVGLYGGKDTSAPAGAPTLVRIDPASGDVVAQIAVGRVPTEAFLHAGAAGLWVRSPDPFLAFVDPATNTVTRSIHANEGVGGVVEVDGRVWVTAGDMNSRVWRLALGN